MSILQQLGLGLVSLYLTACTELPIKCRTYNDTTITINQSTDGITASLDELQQLPENSLLSGGLIDFINETHALSLDGLPQDTKITLVDQECIDVERDILNHPVDAYAVTSNDKGWQRGIYVPKVLSLTNNNFRLLAHEIGHLQSAGGGYDEVIPELNSIEQILNSYVILRSHFPDHINWTRDFIKTVPGTFLTDLLDGDLDTDLHSYMKADIFIFMKLFERNGDFSQVRSEIITLIENGGLEGAIEEKVREFDDVYQLDSYNASVSARRADVALLAELYFFRAFEQRFGIEAAQSYFSSSSLFPYANGDKTPLVGFPNLNCRVTTDELTIQSKEICPTDNPECSYLNSQFRIPQRVTFCCLELIENNTFGAAFSKWLVDGIGYRYVPFEGQSVTLSSNFNWSGPVDVLEIYSRKSIPIGGRCQKDF